MYKIGEIIMYSPEDVCNALHIGKSKCLRLFKNKDFKAINFGNKLLVSETNLKDFLNSGKAIK